MSEDFDRTKPFVGAFDESAIESARESVWNCGRVGDKAPLEIAYATMEIQLAQAEALERIATALESIDKDGGEVFRTDWDGHKIV